MGRTLRRPDPARGRLLKADCPRTTPTTSGQANACRVCGGPSPGCSSASGRPGPGRPALALASRSGGGADRRHRARLLRAVRLHRQPRVRSGAPPVPPRLRHLAPPFARSIASSSTGSSRASCATTTSAERTIIEIGSGKGDFLRALCEEGGNRGIGFDPTSTAPEMSSGPVTADPGFLLGEVRLRGRGPALLPPRAQQHRGPPRVRRDGAPGARRPDAQPGLLRGPRRRRDLPPARGLERGLRALLVLHDPFPLPTLHRVGLRGPRGRAVLSTGEYLGIEASPAPASGRRGRRRGVGRGRGARARDLDVRALYREKVARWNDWLAGLCRAGRTAVLWGSGAAPSASLRPASGRRSPVPASTSTRSGRVSTCLARPSPWPRRSPSPRSRPDELLITNPAFETEIRGQAAALGFRGQIRVLN